MKIRNLTAELDGPPSQLGRTGPGKHRCAKLRLCPRATDKLDARADSRHVLPSQRTRSEEPKHAARRSHQAEVREVHGIGSGHTEARRAGTRRLAQFPRVAEGRCAVDPVY